MKNKILTILLGASILMNCFCLYYIAKPQEDIIYNFADGLSIVEVYQEEVLRLDDICKIEDIDSAGLSQDEFDEFMYEGELYTIHFQVLENFQDEKEHEVYTSAFIYVFKSDDFYVIPEEQPIFAFNQKFINIILNEENYDVLLEWFLFDNNTRDFKSNKVLEIAIPFEVTHGITINNLESMQLIKNINYYQFPSFAEIEYYLKN